MRSIHKPDESTGANQTVTMSLAVLLSLVVVSSLFVGAAAAAITETTTDGPPQATAGETITVGLDISADSPDIGAVQINPEEQDTHVNDFTDTELVDAGGDTQIADPGFIVYDPLQEGTTVTWNVTVPENAEAGETLTLSGDALTGDNERTSFTYTVEVVDAAITDATVTGPDEAVAGDTVDLSLETTADADIISAVQINPDEQPDHINEFVNMVVTDAGADTEVSEQGLIAYTEPQSDQIGRAHV